MLINPSLEATYPHPHTDAEAEIGSVVREVVVPETGNNPSGEAMDLGTLELTPRTEVVASH